MQIDAQHSAQTTPEAVREFYDVTYRQPEGLYEDNPRFYPWIIGLLRPQTGARLLDVGCGQGDLLAAALAAGLTACGVDISPVAVERAQRRAPPATVQVSQGEQLPWPDGSFDYVTNLGSLEHFLDIGQGIREMARVLKPHGCACIMLPNAFWLGSILEVWRSGTYGAVWQVIERSGTSRQWRQLLEAHGFRVQRVLRYNKPVKLFDQHGKLRSLRKFIWRGLLNAATPFQLSWHFVYLCTKS